MSQPVEGTAIKSVLGGIRRFRTGSATTTDKVIAGAILIAAGIALIVPQQDREDDSRVMYALRELWARRDWLA